MTPEDRRKIVGTREDPIRVITRATMTLLMLASIVIVWFVMVILFIRFTLA